jgi:hypothetical protein
MIRGVKLLSVSLNGLAPASMASGARERAVTPSKPADSIGLSSVELRPAGHQSWHHARPAGPRRPHQGRHRLVVRVVRRGAFWCFARAKRTLLLFLLSSSFWRSQLSSSSASKRPCSSASSMPASSPPPPSSPLRHRITSLEKRRAPLIVCTPAAGTGLALRNLAPKSSSIGERSIGNHRKYRCLAQNWPAPMKLGPATS